METASIQIAFDYDIDDWKLTIEVIKADIIPADEDKVKEGELRRLAPKSVCCPVNIYSIHVNPEKHVIY